jgi:hypothetical protein
MKIRHGLTGLAAAAILVTGASLAPTATADDVRTPAGAAPAENAHPQDMKTPRAGAPGGLTLHPMEVPLTSLPAATQKAMRAQGKVTAQDTIVGYQIVNDKYNKCLDANGSGPTAGQNRDKVQLWDCIANPSKLNQGWVPWQRTNGYTELVNLEYTDPAMCLDVDTSGGFVNGAKVQLWHCFGDDTNHQNQWWNYALGSNTPIPVRWNGGTKVLDANVSGPTAGQNGDQVQVWDYLDVDQQFWYQ